MTFSSPTLQNDQVSLISILNWNGLPDTIRCLTNLVAYKSNRFKIIVLDNGSDVDATQTLLELFPEVGIIRTHTNLGFTGGHNEILKIALEKNYHSVLILNNDSELSDHAAEQMRELMDTDPKIGAVSAMVYRRQEERRAMMIGGYIEWRSSRSIRPSVLGEATPTDAPTLLVGTAVLLRTAAIRKIGLLDDRYFAYYDDNDLSARLFSSGLTAQYCTEAECYHDYKSLSDHSVMAHYLLSRNRWLFWRTHTPQLFRKNLTLRLLGQSILDTKILIKNGAQPEKLHAIADGMWDAWHGRWGAPARQRFSPSWLRLVLRVAPFRLGALLEALSTKTL